MHQLNWQGSLGSDGGGRFAAPPDPSFWRGKKTFTLSWESAQKLPEPLRKLPVFLLRIKEKQASPFFCTCIVLDRWSACWLSHKWWKQKLEAFVELSEQQAHAFQHVRRAAAILAAWNQATWMFTSCALEWGALQQEKWIAWGEWRGQKLFMGLTSAAVGEASKWHGSGSAEHGKPRLTWGYWSNHLWAWADFKTFSAMKGALRWIKCFMLSLRLWSSPSCEEDAQKCFLQQSKLGKQHFIHYYTVTFQGNTIPCSSLPRSSLFFTSPLAYWTFSYIFQLLLNSPFLFISPFHLDSFSLSLLNVMPAL